MPGIRRRFLHFVRHGTYVPCPANSPRGGGLDDMGRTQSRMTAQYLRKFPIRVIHTSDMLRCTETSDLITPMFPGARFHQTKVIREVNISALEEPPDSDNARKVKEHVELIWSQFFRRPRELWHEVLVTHGNLIRTMVCAVLRIRLTAWAYMQTHNCGITTFVIGSNGRVQLMGFNDIAHMPPAFHTSPK